MNIRKTITWISAILAGLDIILALAVVLEV